MPWNLGLIEFAAGHRRRTLCHVFLRRVFVYHFYSFHNSFVFPFCPLFVFNLLLLFLFVLLNKTRTLIDVSYEEIRLLQFMIAIFTLPTPVILYAVSEGLAYHFL